ncbi:MAG TPA: hypothetical protein VFC41_06170 [Anaerovoracaceae bacterium]|nr:hypothetical protein [Anaerovoracaceae bacterium]
MNIIMRSITKSLTGGVQAFKTFPAAIGSALAFAVVTVIRIQLEWPQQEPYNFLFNCLHWSFALGAIFSLMIITGAQSRYNKPKAFLAANILGIISAGITFVLLYMFGGTDPNLIESRFTVVSGLSVARVSMVMLVSYLMFVVLAGVQTENNNMSEAKEKNIKVKYDFAKSFFMSHKAFFIAVIYGIVMMAGASGVAGAVQALIYNDMSSKVYMYIGTVVGFLVFTIYTGYFPDFRMGALDEHREVAQKQPRFVEILFGYIMVPIVLALTVVLFIWAGRTVMGGTGALFIRLSSIAAAYTVGGIWLHIMVTHHESGVAKFYRRIYPIAALVILVFEAWALINQLGKSGLKVTEYTFIIIWIVAATGAVLLLLLKNRAHPVIVAITCGLAIISVLPIVGYHALPVTAQVNRLETLLISEEMLVDDKLVAAVTEPELAVREAITDSVDYLANADSAKLPVWFNKDFRDSLTFKKTFGFDQVFPKVDITGPPSGYMGTSLYLKAEAIDIGEYRWVVNPQDEYQKESNSITVDGDKGTYKIYWNTTSKDGIPVLEIQLNDKVIINKDMNEYIDVISEKFPPGNTGPIQADLDDLSLKLESDEINVLLVFSNVEINIDPSNDIINYGINLDSLYMAEKI